MNIHHVHYNEPTNLHPHRLIILSRTFFILHFLVKIGYLLFCFWLLVLSLYYLKIPIEIPKPSKHFLSHPSNPKRGQGNPPC